MTKGIKALIITVAVIVILVGILITFLALDYNNLDQDSVIDKTYCEVDADCIEIHTGKCCDFTAVNKKYKSLVKETHMTCERLCNIIEPACVNNKCELTEKPGLQF